MAEIDYTKMTEAEKKFVIQAAQAYELNEAMNETEDYTLTEGIAKVGKLNRSQIRELGEGRKSLRSIITFCRKAKEDLISTQNDRLGNLSPEALGKMEVENLARWRNLEATARAYDRRAKNPSDPDKSIPRPLEYVQAREYMNLINKLIKIEWRSE
jgi:hypothetical protein